MKTKRLIILFLIFNMLIAIFNINPNTIYATNEVIQNQANLHIYSDAVILIDNKTGKVLYEKNSEQKMYPASTTKVLTAILTIERGNLQDTVTVSKSAIAQMKSGYSSAYLSEGEVMSVENLLKVLLVHSANDASNVLAEYISGSIDNFVALMNNKAQELGCQNTHFVTTNGLHDDNHYTTAKDLCTIARYCMQNETFRKIVAMKSCTIPATNKSAERVYKNTNDLVNPSSMYYYPGCVGIKTGYTSEAKNCLISACSKNGLQLIAVVLGASLTENKRSARYVDSKALYEYGYSNYSVQTIAKSTEVANTIEINNATDETKSLDLIIENDITALINNADKDNIKQEIKLNENLSAPIAANTVIGKIDYIIGDETYSANLLSSHNVEKKENLIGILRIVFILVIILIAMILIIKLLIKNKVNKGKH